MADDDPIHTTIMTDEGILTEEGHYPWGEVRWRNASSPSLLTELRFMRPEVNSAEVAFSIDLSTGKVTLAEGMEPDEAARLFWDAVRRLAPQLPQ